MEMATVMTTEQYYSQYGEDRILSRIFSGKKNGVCVEVGGYDGITGSNSYFFEKAGWTCLVVEPIPEFCDKIRKNRTCEVLELAASDANGDVTLHVADGVETLSTIESDPDHFARIRKEGGKQIRKISVKKRRLAEILQDRNLRQPDFISIDVEGHEMAVLRGLSLESTSPRVLIIEDNSNGLNGEVRKYLGAYGYVRFNRTGCNDWYAKSTDHDLVTNYSRLMAEIKVLLRASKSLAKKALIRYRRRPAL